MTMADDRADRLSPPGRMNQRLARLGFVDPDRAAAVLAAPPLSWWDSEASAPASPGAAAVIAALGRASDPDLAVNALADLARTAVGDDVAIVAVRTRDERPGALPPDQPARCLGRARCAFGGLSGPLARHVER